MKVLLKILTAPVVLLLTILVWVASAILYCSAFVFGLAGTVLGLLGLAVLLTCSVKNGIILMVIAFAVSPLGLPMAAVWMVGKVQGLRCTIQDCVWG